MEASDEPPRQHPRRAVQGAAAIPSGVQATIEPKVENPRGGAADQRRGDIKVHKDDTTWMLDVGVVCSCTHRYVSDGADTSPGVAATAYASVKCARHEDQPNFVPFIVETGGRVNRAGLHILDLLSGKASQTWPLRRWMVGRRGLGLWRSHTVASGPR